ncbi:MAG TPA: ABC transporter ATP-binding protein [Bryobacteraceae bacterium]|nr:ABC transporter ATP-binding protein [Bryobacteraceae bacterium]
MNSSPMIEAIGLSKFYRDFAAIRDVSFSIPAGQVVAFLGPNGAGKSTTMKILTGYLAPSAGTARIAGLDVVSDRIRAAERLGYLPENGPLYPEMTPLALLRFFGYARGLTGAHLKARIDEVIHRCALESVIEKSIRKLSKGYRQRVGMAQVLLHEPDVLIMDEPTSGLDPNQIREVRRTIREMAGGAVTARTILLSTHILQEVDAVADRVILIDRGRIVFDGTPREMQGEHATLDEAFFALTSGAPANGAPANAALTDATTTEGGPCATAGT